MDSHNIISILKEKNFLWIEKLITEKGNKNAISTFAEFLDKRAYFSIDEDGIIKRKAINYTLSIAAFSDNTDEISKALIELSDPKERLKLKKIDRLSKESMSKLKKNFFKVIASGNLEFSLKYAKEIFMRDSEFFYKKLFHYTLLEEVDSQKTLMALSLKKLMGYELNDNLMYLAMAYITKAKSNFSEYENTQICENNTKEQLKHLAEEKKESFYNKKGLNLLFYIKVLNEYQYDNEEFFINIALKKLKDLESTPDSLSHFEQVILEGFIQEDIR